MLRDKHSLVPEYAGMARVSSTPERAFAVLSLFVLTPSWPNLSLCPFVEQYYARTRSTNLLSVDPIAVVSKPAAPFAQHGTGALGAELRSTAAALRCFGAGIIKKWNSSRLPENSKIS